MLGLKFPTVEGVAAGMIPMFLGKERRLFASYHESDPAARQHRAVLLCNPFGQEALRTHRLYRVLAERLARSGVDVMRFDYYGTGDSYGDDEEGELAGWTQDLLTAHGELLKYSGARAVAWVGIRLGATVASRAAMHAGAELQQLVLVDPVIDGAAYSRRLREQHVERLESVFRRPAREWRRELESNPDAFANEASGFGLAPGFHADLARITVRDFAPSPGRRTTVLFDDEDGSVGSWRTSSRGDANLEWITVNHGFDWTAHEADGALLPDKVLRELLKVLAK